MNVDGKCWGTLGSLLRYETHLVPAETLSLEWALNKPSKVALRVYGEASQSSEAAVETMLRWADGCCSGIKPAGLDALLALASHTSGESDTLVEAAQLIWRTALFDPAAGAPPEA